MPTPTVSHSLSADDGYCVNIGTVIIVNNEKLIIDGCYPNGKQMSDGAKYYIQKSESTDKLALKKDASGFHLIRKTTNGSKNLGPLSAFTSKITQLTDGCDDCKEAKYIAIKKCGTSKNTSKLLGNSLNPVNYFATKSEDSFKTGGTVTINNECYKIQEKYNSKALSQSQDLLENEIDGAKGKSAEETSSDCKSDASIDQCDCCELEVKIANGDTSAKKEYEEKCCKKVVISPREQSYFGSRGVVQSASGIELVISPNGIQHYEICELSSAFDFAEVVIDYQKLAASGKYPGISKGEGDITTRVMQIRAVENVYAKSFDHHGTVNKRTDKNLIQYEGLFESPSPLSPTCPDGSGCGNNKYKNKAHGKYFFQPSEFSSKESSNSYGKSVKITFSPDFSYRNNQPNIDVWKSGFTGTTEHPSRGHGLIISDRMYGLAVDISIKIDCDPAVEGGKCYFFEVQVPLNFKRKGCEHEPIASPSYTCEPVGDTGRDKSGICCDSPDDPCATPSHSISETPERSDSLPYFYIPRPAKSPNDASYFPAMIVGGMDTTFDPNDPSLMRQVLVAWAEASVAGKLGKTKVGSNEALMRKDWAVAHHLYDIESWDFNEVIKIVEEKRPELKGKEQEIYDVWFNDAAISMYQPDDIEFKPWITKDRQESVQEKTSPRIIHDHASLPSWDEENDHFVTFIGGSEHLFSYNATGQLLELTEQEGTPYFQPKSNIGEMLGAEFTNTRSLTGDTVVYTPVNKEGENLAGEGVIFTKEDGKTKMTWFYGLSWQDKEGTFGPYTEAGSESSKQSVALGGESLLVFSHEFNEVPEHHGVSLRYLQETNVEGATARRILTYNWYKECWTHMSLPNASWDKPYVIYSTSNIDDWPSADDQKLLSVDRGSDGAQGENVEFFDTVRLKKDNALSKMETGAYVYRILDPSNQQGSNRNLQTHPSLLAYWSSWAKDNGHSFGNLTKTGFKNNQNIANIVDLPDFSEPQMEESDGYSFSVARHHGVQDHFTPLSIGDEDIRYGVPGEATEVRDPDLYYAGLGTLLLSDNKYVRQATTIPVMWEGAHKFSEVASKTNSDEVHVGSGLTIPSDWSATNWHDGYEKLSGEDRKKLSLQMVWYPQEWRAEISRVAYIPAVHITNENLQDIGRTNNIQWKGIDNDPSSPTYGEATEEE